MLGVLAAWPTSIFRHRHLIWAMAVHELAQRYVGTLGGPLWAILQPLSIVAVYWFIFSFGFRARGPDGAPFVVYFLAGFIPWLLFSETLNASTYSVERNSYLVKKIVFPTEVLPLVQLVASTLTHVILLVVLIVVIWLSGMHVSFLLPQVLYYYVALASFTMGLAWLLSALQVLNRDVGQLTQVAINLWFWLTPIVWTVNAMPDWFGWFVQFNPASYIVAGYRDSLVYGTPLWQDPAGLLRFWGVAGPTIALGIYVFRRLKPEFADVL